MAFSKWLAAIGMVGLCAVVSACSSFAPVYGDGPSGGMANARFNFAAPSNRMEQVIINRLKLAFPGAATASDPVLQVRASQGAQQASMSESFAIARPVSLEVNATVTIRQGDAVLFEATRVSGSAYQSGKLTVTELASSSGTQEIVAGSTADALRAAIWAGYRPGQMVPAR